MNLSCLCTAGKHPASLLKGIRSETTLLIHPNLPAHLSQAPLPQAEQETFCTKPNPAALMPPPVLGTAARSRDMQEMFSVLSAGPGAGSLPGGAERQLLHLFPLWEPNLGIHVGERHHSWSHRLQKHKAEPVPAWGLQQSNQEQGGKTRIQRLLCKSRGPLGHDIHLCWMRLGLG